MKLLHLIAAARPNFMKIAPLYRELKKSPWADPVIVPPGQPYDVRPSDAFFSDAFFEELRLPAPHHHLGVGSGTHGEQTGRVMIACEKLLTENRPDFAVVVGGMHSTAAGTLAAVKLGVKTAHFEGGCAPLTASCPRRSTVSSPMRRPSFSGRPRPMPTRIGGARASPQRGSSVSATS